MTGVQTCALPIFKKEFEDGKFPNATPENLVQILKFIEKKDPTHHDVAAETPVPSSSPLTHSDGREQHLGELIGELNGLHFSEEVESIRKLAGLK